MGTRSPVALVGIFVGGGARRMGGIAKGLLPARDTGEPLVARLARIANELGAEPVLVGRSDPYVHALPTLQVIEDHPTQVGPLGGLNGLLLAAGTGPAIALACDMPWLSAALLRRLMTSPSQAMVLAPRGASGLWEPLCARYDPPSVAPLCAAALARGVRSFQLLFASLEIEELTLDPTEQHELTDWDQPDDLTR